MKKQQNILTEADVLRQKAEGQLKKRQSKVNSYSSENDMRKLLHELEVHKIELELQNEELVLAKDVAVRATEKYLELYDFAPSGYFILSEEGKIIGLNLKGSSMLGKERKKLINKQFGFFLSNDTKPIFNIFLSKVFNSKAEESCEITLSTDGNLPMYVYLNGIVTETGEQCFVNVMNITDGKRAAELIIVNKELIFQITERKLAGDALRESEESYRKLFENHSAVKIILDPDTGAILDANDAAAQYYGWTREELKHMKIYQINTLSPKEVNVEMERVRSERRIRFEFRHRRADGSIRDVEVFSSKIEIRGKDVLHSIIQDITERKRAELELILANKELAFQNEVNKVLEQFTYVVSHNLQEPLRTISNYIQVFEEDYLKILDENACKYLNLIDDSAKRMSWLLNSLSDISQLGRNIKLTNVDCKKIIYDVIADLDTLIKNSNAIIEVTEMPVLNGYEIELRQLFQNLIANAIKFRKKDIQPKINIRSERINDKWKFSISDNGIGIASVNFDRIFDIFQRLHTDTEYEGNGIGLSNCKKIVQLHHGEIWIESYLGQGSTFHFTIPNLTV